MYGGRGGQEGQCGGQDKEEKDEEEACCCCRREVCSARHLYLQAKNQAN